MFMPRKSIFALMLAAGLLVPDGLRAEPTAATVPAQLQALVAQVQTKAQAGQRAEADYTNELATLDSLIASNKTAKSDEAVQITYMKAMLYLEVIKDFDKGAVILRQIATNYPNTEYSQSAGKLLARIEGMKATAKLQEGLAVGAAFPDFAVTNLDGAPLSVGALKGKVVLVDFWATWCGPCRAELPNVIETYQKYHARGFEIIGVTLDSERDKLEAFLQQQAGMTWPQYFDGQGWGNQLAVKYGVNSIPFAILIGPDGKIIGTELRGEELQTAVAKAVAELPAKH
jgi:thiol-disulfide isomerase/thioredoxin